MNWYLDAFKKYTVFSGRARRKEYWYFFLFSFLILIVLNIIAKIIESRVIIYVYDLAILLPYIGVAIRRKHDVGKSGWFSLIPIYNLILNCTDGDVGTNEYGTDPKNGAEFGAADYEKPFDINPEV